MKKSKTPIHYGIGIGVALILYFLFLSIFGANTKPIFSLLNGPIMFIGMYYGLKVYKKEKGTDFKYDKGYTAAMFIGFNATLIFTVFFACYGSFINPGFMEELMGNWSTHYNTSSGLLLFVVFIMGMATTMVLSLTLMQWFKESWNLKFQPKKTIMLPESFK